MTTSKKKTRKAPEALDSAVSAPPPPLGVQMHYGHSRYVPKWYKVLKLVIFLSFDVCAAIPPQRLLRTLLLVISWIPYSMNTFPFPHSLVIHLF